MSYLQGQTYCKEPNQIPTEPHYAIIEFDNYHVAGWDEKDPGYSDSKANYIVFDTKENWEAEIQKRALSRNYHDNKWVAVHVNPAKVQISASVSVNTNH